MFLFLSLFVELSYWSCNPELFGFMPQVVSKLCLEEVTSDTRVYVFRTLQCRATCHCVLYHCKQSNCVISFDSLHIGKYLEVLHFCMWNLVSARARIKLELYPRNKIPHTKFSTKVLRFRKYREAKSRIGVNSGFKYRHKFRS
jgi:hypothetical protein